MKLGSIHQISESKFQVWDFIYKDYNKDPSPRALILGAFDNSNTGNRLIAAVNTRLLSTGEAKRLYSILDQIRTGSNLKERVNILRKLSGDIFDKAYRTYDSSKMVSVEKNFVYTNDKLYNKAREKDVEIERVDKQQVDIKDDPQTDDTKDKLEITKNEKNRYEADDRKIQKSDKQSQGELEGYPVEDPEFEDEDRGGEDTMEYGEYRSNNGRDKPNNRKA